jgi:phosphoribosyl-AMP cyclohydrolase
MKARVESTEQIVNLSVFPGTRARVWKAITESGVEFQMVVVRVAVDKDADCSQFERELEEKHAPAVWPAAFDLRMVL